MKLQRNVYKTVLSLTTVVALGVTGVQAQTVIEAAPPAQAIQNNNIVDVQPVGLSPGMEPTRVPRTESVQLEGADGIRVDGASTGIEGDNPGNANTGGVQVQNVTVQANPEMDGANGYSAVDSLKRRRKSIETDSESRLLEKIEEGRLIDERERARKVEELNSNFRADNGLVAPAYAQDVQVVSVEAVGAAQPVMAPISTVATTKPNSSRSKVAITPFAGKKWIYDEDAQFSAYNYMNAGVNLEGRISSYFGVEASMGWSRDEFEYNGFYMPYDYYSQQALLETKTRDTWEVGGNLIVGPNNKKFRPYGLVGVGVMYQNYDVDDEYHDYMLEEVGLKRATTHVFTNFGGGLDYKFTQNFAIGGRVDYQYVYGDADHLMNYHFGDVANRTRFTGSLQLLF